MDRVKFFLAILTLLKQTDLHVTKDLTGSRLNYALTGLQLIQSQTVLLILILLEQRDLQIGEKKTDLL